MSQMPKNKPKWMCRGKVPWKSLVLWKYWAKKTFVMCWGMYASNVHDPYKNQQK